MHLLLAFPSFAAALAVKWQAYLHAFAKQNLETNALLTDVPVTCYLPTGRLRTTWQH